MFYASTRKYPFYISKKDIYCLESIQKQLICREPFSHFYFNGFHPNSKVLQTFISWQERGVISLQPRTAVYEVE